MRAAGKTVFSDKFHKYRAEDADKVNEGDFLDAMEEDLEMHDAKLMAAHAHLHQH